MAFFSGRVCYYLTEECQKGYLDPTVIQKLTHIKDLLADVIDEIAEVEDPDDNADSHGAIFCLGLKGLRVDNQKVLAVSFHWKEQHYTFIEMKLAEKKLISSSDLKSKGLYDRNPSLNEIIRRLTLYLNPETPMTKALKNLKSIIFKIDYIVMPLFSSVFMLYSLFCGLFYSSSLTFASAVWLSYRGYNLNPRKPYELQEESVLRRLLWMENMIPQYILGIFVGKFFQNAVHL